MREFLDGSDGEDFSFDRLNALVRGFLFAHKETCRLLGETATDAGQDLDPPCLAG